MLAKVNPLIKKATDRAGFVGPSLELLDFPFSSNISVE